MLNGNEYGGWPMLEFMVISSLIWLLLLAVGAWALVVWIRRRDGHLRSPSALEILGERYARGEIDSDTFRRMRDDLDGTVQRNTEHVTIDQ